MESFRNILTLWRRVFSKPQYIALTLLIAFLFYFLDGVLYNIDNIRPLFAESPSLAASFLINSSVNYIWLLESYAALGILIISLQMGMLISLLTYRFNLAKETSIKKVGTLSSIGLFLGAAAPGCAACGVGLLSFLGFSAVLAALPFHGQEIIVFAILLLGYSIYSLSAKIYNPSCQVKFNPNAKKQLKGGKKQIGKQ